jgi:hypothetical protein
MKLLRVLVPVICFFIACCCLPFSGKTQEKKGIHYSALLQGGIMSGKHSNELVYQFINGVRYRNTFLGAGVGVDPYGIRTIPVFLSLRQQVFSKKNTPFIYLDLGLSIPENKRDSISTWWWTKKYITYRKGLYYDIGAGYELPISDQFRVLMSVGYSRKESTEYHTWGPATSNDYTERFDFFYRRISVKLGVRF